MEVALVISKPDGTSRNFPIVKQHTVVGRGRECDLRVPLQSVSREHCELILDQGRLKVKNLNNTGQTFVNTEKIEELALSDGDRLTVGPVEFTVAFGAGTGRVVTDTKTTPEGVATVIQTKATL